MRLVLRPATPDDMPVLLEIEEQSFSHPHWQAKDFLADECVVAVTDGRVVGFLVSRQIYCEGREAAAEREILNVAVAGEWRRRGIATALLESELRRKAIFYLEVRESNEAAQALYRTLGFVEISRRREYYREPREGAIVMQMKKC